jgi:flagellar basal-body rod modification protein FlgD
MSIDTSIQTTSPSQTAGAPGSGSTTAAVGGTSSDQQDKFLKLLVTQLKNQDPLNPMDNAQITSQMAQLSSLQGIEKLNTTLASLATSLTGNQAMQAAALVGHDVMAPGSAIQLAGGHAFGGVDLPQAVDQLKVTITDSSGAVVHSAVLGAQPQGIVQINWDGITDTGAAAVDGKYHLSVTATAQGQPVTAQTLMVGHVHGITAGADGTNLDLGALGNVSLSKVKQFL